MSNLSSVNIRGLAIKYNLEVFIETGSEGGDGIATALRANFKELYSCEIVKDRCEKTQRRFEGFDNVGIYSGDSKEWLPKMIHKAGEKKILFWLDAHLPHFGDNKDYPLDKMLPAVDELKIISEMRKANKDVLLIDDLRIIFTEYATYGGFDLQPWVKNKGNRYETVHILKDLFPYHKMQVNLDGDVLMYLEPI